MKIDGVITQVLIRRLLKCKVCQQEDLFYINFFCLRLHLFEFKRRYHVFNFSFMLILDSFVIPSIRAIDVNYSVVQAALAA